MTDLSTESELFVATARAFLDKTAALSDQRDLHARGQSYDAAWWRQAAELGWAGLLVPEELGGGSVSGCGLRDLAAIATEIGRTVAPGPLHPVSVVLAGLVDADNAATHADSIAALIAGETVATWAPDEPGRRFAPHRPGLQGDARARHIGAQRRIDRRQPRPRIGGAAHDLLAAVLGVDLADPQPVGVRVLHRRLHVGDPEGRERRAAILDALGAASSVVNVGAGAGSYEPRDRRVVAVEPSAVMVAQRPPGSAQVVHAVAEHLPFADGAFDAVITDEPSYATG